MIKAMTCAMDDGDEEGWKGKEEEEWGSLDQQVPQQGPPVRYNIIGSAHSPSHYHTQEGEPLKKRIREGFFILSLQSVFR